MPPPSPQVFRRIAPIGGLLLLAVLFAQLGPGRILSLLLALGVNFLVIVLIFGCHECVRAAAISRCFPSSGSPPYRRLLRIRFLGEIAGTLTRTGPFVAEPARAWMLAGQATHGAHAYGAAVSELIANSCMSALVSVGAIAFAWATRDLHGQVYVLSVVVFWSSLVYVTAIVVALALRVRLIGPLLRLASRLPGVGKRLKANPRKVEQMEDAIIHILRDRPATLGQILVLEVLAQSILVFEIYWTIRSMGPVISIGTALLIEALSKAPNVIQFVGITEAGYAVVFNWLGMTAAVGFTLSIVRLLRSVTASALGLGFLHGLDRSLLMLTVAASPRIPPR
jgi:hypothetical protein